MYCPRCGREINISAVFCTHCGAQVNQAPRVNQVPQQKKHSNKALIIALSCVAALLLIVSVAFFVFLNRGHDDSDRSAFGGKASQTYGDNSEPNETVEEHTSSTVPTETDIEHTIMIYMVGSDLEHDNGFGSMDIAEMLDADYGENTRIVLQTGGCSDWKIEAMTDGQVERWELCGGDLVRLETLGKMSMLQVDTLADFITFAAETYPAEKYSLVMWDHGGGVPIGFGVDDMFPYDTLYDYQIGEALAQAGVYFECVAFDACNMCTLEVAMAIKDYAKYMVAAESFIVGYGMDYTGWLNCYGEDDIVLSESYEEMAMAYMDSVDATGQVGSISVINLNKIQAVYDAYVAYIFSVHEDILNGGYEEYILARENCGLYQYTESVDIVTLATTYPTDAASELINATVNAVCYTESDYAFGHGLAVFNPGEYMQYYGYARENMTALGYDTTLLEFYDDIVSINLAFCGTDYVDAYAGDWFDEELAVSYAGTEYEPEEETINLEQMDGYQAIPISEADWAIISNVETTVFAMPDDETVYVLGMDNLYSTDENGYIVVEKPQRWTYVNDNVACYIAVDYWEDASSGAWSQLGSICASCNGEPILILVYYDQEHAQGTILGYLVYDYFKGEADEELRQFTENDVVEIVLPAYNLTTDEQYYVNLSGCSYYASDLELQFDFIDLDSVTVCVDYDITDVYENTYSTDWVIFYQEE